MAYADGSSVLPRGIYVRQSERWPAILSELEELVNDPRVTERDLQDFFEQHPQLLRARDNTPTWRADFVLCPYDQVAFSKVLEIKPPHMPIARSVISGHAIFYVKFHSAIGQVRDYAESFKDPAIRRRFSDKYGLEVYRPEAELIIGRRVQLDSVQNLLDM